MHWVKEVELVDSVDDLKTSSSVRGIRMPDFEVLDTRIGRNKRPKKQDRFLRGRQIAYLIYEYFRVIGANDSVENYSDLFTKEFLETVGNGKPTAVCERRQLQFPSRYQ